MILVAKIGSPDLAIILVCSFSAKRVHPASNLARAGFGVAGLHPVTPSVF